MFLLGLIIIGFSSGWLRYTLHSWATVWRHQLSPRLSISSMWWTEMCQKLWGSLSFLATAWANAFNPDMNFLRREAYLQVYHLCFPAAQRFSTVATAVGFLPPSNRCWLPPSVRWRQSQLLQSRRFWVLGCSIPTAEHATTIHLLGILVGKCHILSL